MVYLLLLPAPFTRLCRTPVTPTNLDCLADQAFVQCRRFQRLLVAEYVQLTYRLQPLSLELSSLEEILREQANVESIGS